MFVDFESTRAQTSSAEIAVWYAGSVSPSPLLHGRQQPPECADDVRGRQLECGQNVEKEPSEQIPEELLACLGEDRAGPGS